MVDPIPRHSARAQAAARAAGKAGARRGADAHEGARVNGLAYAIAGMTGWRRWGTAAGAGALSALAMAPFFVWPLLMLTLPILVWLLDGICLRKGLSIFGRLRRAAAVGWWFGFGYFLAGLYWIGHAFLVDADRFAWLLPIAVPALPAGMALYFCVAAMAAALAWRPGAARIVSLALCLFATEWLRGHLFTGFPWITLGYALTAGVTLMQWAALVGVHVLTAVTVLALASPACLWGPREALDGSRRRRLGLPVVMATVLACGYGYGGLRLAEAQVSLVPDVRLRIMQPNIPQSEKWRENREDWVFQTYLDLSRTPGAGGDALAGITHLIWPESAFPFLLAHTPPALAALADLLPPGTTFLTGAMHAEADPGRPGGLRVYNSLYVMDDEADILAIYHKTHLVPFGEFLPFQDTMEAIGIAQLTGIRGGFSAGLGPRFMRAPGVPPFAPLICYEIIFPSAVLDGGERPQWLLNVTNDGWFGNSTGPYQHLQQARVRAVEEGLPLVRAANTGVSAVVDPYGRVRDSLPLNVAGIIDSGLPRAITPPPYARMPRRIELAVAVLLLLASLFLARNRRT